jgi:hypothetical protein
METENATFTNLRPRFGVSTLPNREGFKFIGFFKDGSCRECTVILVDGSHKVDGFQNLIGWSLK